MVRKHFLPLSRGQLEALDHFVLPILTYDGDFFLSQSAVCG